MSFLVELLYNNDPCSGMFISILYPRLYNKGQREYEKFDHLSITKGE